MTTTITAPTANDDIAELHAMPSRSRDWYAAAIELRLLGAHEAHVAQRLAALDDAPELEGQVIAALSGGQAVAALSLGDDRVVANPFMPTSDAIVLLRLRAAQLSTGRRRPSRFRRLRRA